jgi:hypothetical protein
MGRIWHKDGREWRALPIPFSEVTNLSVVRFGSGSESGVALIVRDGVSARVNGRPVPGGLRVLEHRDELLLGQERLFYSAESTPLVVAFHNAAGNRAPTCPLCRGPIRDGQQAVQCPGCARWFHQIAATSDAPGKPCWTYAETCRFCNHPTALSGEPAWHPGLEEMHE